MAPATEPWIPADTTPEAWAEQTRLIRRLTPGERVARSLERSAWMRAAMLAGIRMRRPEASEHEVRREFARLLGFEIPGGP
ncbi:MAG: hypothetical protein HMLKMBBP_01449 [Planctomycetes bacterium]|nr:hypothetical protein [Planctomycetota bacterium]